MNSFKGTIKKVFLFVMLITMVFVLTSCAKAKNPTISNYDGTYVSVSENGFEYSINNGEMYDTMKASYGLTTAIKMINTQILKEEKLNGVTYFDSVKDDVTKAIEDAIFPDGKENLTAEEIKEAEDNYKESMFTSYGYITDEATSVYNSEAIKAHHQLTLAKKLYAKTQLDSEVKELGGLKEYFSAAAIKSNYNSNYIEDYWLFVLPYASQVAVNNALSQLGISYHKKDATIEGDVDKWVKASDGTALTTTEIVQAFIDLYNTMYGYKAENYPTDNKVLKAGTQYTLENGVYTFNKEVDEENESKNELHYSLADLKAFSTQLHNYIEKNMTAYSSEATVADSWYSVKPINFSGGAIHYLVLEVANEEAPELEEVEEEILDKLLENELSSSYIEKKIAALRAQKNIQIFDTDLESSYITNIASYDVDYEETEKGKTNNVVSIDGFAITADDLFNEIDKTQGAATAINKLVYERLLADKSVNPYYDYVNNKWLDKNKLEQMKDNAEAEKKSFEEGTYVEYGYDPASISWKEFMKAVYGSASEDELYVYLLTADLEKEFVEKLQTIATKEDGEYIESENGELWTMINGAMENIVSKYFKVDGVHLLICQYKSFVDEVAGANAVDPEEWNEEQVKLAKELHAQVKEYINNNKDNQKIEAILQKIATEFRKSPLNALDGSQPIVENASYSLENIEISKFKSAGLTVKYEDLGTFTNGAMVPAFNDAVKSIWDMDNDSDEMVIYDEPIQTVYGFHLYVNQSTTPVSEWEATLNFQINKEETYIQYRYVSELEWTNLKALSETDIQKGKSVVFSTSGDNIQWKYTDGVNTKLMTFEEAGISKTAKGVLPTLGIVRKYNDSTLYTSLTEKMKTAYTTYFSPIYSEIGGQYYPLIMQYEAMKLATFDLQGKTNYSNADLLYTLDKYIETYKDKLTYLG